MVAVLNRVRKFDHTFKIVPKPMCKGEFMRKNEVEMWEFLENLTWETMQ